MRKRPVIGDSAERNLKKPPQTFLQQSVSFQSQLNQKVKKPSIIKTQPIPPVEKPYVTPEYALSLVSALSMRPCLFCLAQLAQKSRFEYCVLNLFDIAREKIKICSLANPENFHNFVCEPSETNLKIE